MLDFDGTVLAALQGTFSRPIVVYPVASQPGEPSYPGRGVFSTAPVDILAEVNSVFSDQHTSIWIRLSEFPIPPLQRDKIFIPANLNYPEEGMFEVHDVDRHAGGKVILELKRVQS